MPSGSEEDINIGQVFVKTYQDLVRAEQTASELESRLDNLDDQLEALIRASNIPPELFSMDDETLKRTLDAASANREKKGVEKCNSSNQEDIAHQANGAGERKDG